MKTRTSLLSYVTTCLAATSDTPALDASVLLAHIIDKPRTWILAHPEQTLTPEQQALLNDALEQLKKGKPFPYVLGRWEFFGLELEVTPDVLIPRPETELLVEKAIAWTQKNPARTNIADIGTGSGAIAVSLAVNLPHINILATDVSPQALQIAKRNAEKHGVKNRIEFIECDLLPIQSSIVDRKSKIDILCANLPYIPNKTLTRLPVFGREPTVALDGGKDGLELYRRLLDMAPAWLASNGLILFEIESTCGPLALNLAHEMLPDSSMHLYQDLTGLDRLLEIQV